MSTEPSQDSPSTPYLVVHTGDVRQTFDPVHGAVVIGREAPAQVQITDPRISRTHVRLEPGADGWTAVDNSRNGMFVDGERQTSVELSDGLTVELGNPLGIAVTFELVDPSEVTHLRLETATGAEPDADWTGEETDPGIQRAGAAVAARRDQLGIAQRELARNKIMNAGALIAFEKGRSWPRKQTLLKLEDVLGWPPGTITRIRHGGSAPDDESTEVITNTVHAPLMAQAVELALNNIATMTETLPPPADPEFGKRAAGILADLRKLEAVAANAARTAIGTPEVVMALSTVRKRYDELMMRAARGPDATLGQRLYAARRRAGLTVDESANAAGVPVEVVTLAESEGAVAPQSAAAIEQLIAVLTNR